MSNALRTPWQLLEERFAFNTHTGEFFLLNAEGADAFRLAVQGSSADAIARSLSANFEVPSDAALRDAEQFLARLRALTLLDTGPSRLDSRRN